MPAKNPIPRLDHYPEIMTPEECASYVQISKKTLERDVQAGVFPHFKIGRQTRFKKTAVDRWAEFKTQGDLVQTTR